MGIFRTSWYIIPYIKKIQKIYKSHEAPHELCWHQQFFTGNQQLLLYQELPLYKYIISNFYFDKARKIVYSGFS